MKLFGRYKQTDAASTPATAVAETPGERAAGKGRPTPTRAEAEAARMAALHPNLTKKEIAAQERQARAIRQQRALAAADAEPAKVLMRNYVDARWSLTEFSMPTVLLVFVLAMLASRGVPMLGIAGTIVLYVYLLACIVNVTVYWRGFKKELYIRHPGASSKGLLFSMISRMIALRRFRQPGTAIARGQVY